jgi:hypothetical protein
MFPLCHRDRPAFAAACAPDIGCSSVMDGNLAMKTWPSTFGSTLRYTKDCEPKRRISAANLLMTGTAVVVLQAEERQRFLRSALFSAPVHSIGHGHVVA